MAKNIPTPAEESASKKTLASIRPDAIVTHCRKPRTPRTVSPEVEAIRDECREKLQALHDSVGSGRMLQTIIEKRLPKMNKEYRQNLFDVLAHEFTPALM